MVSSLKLTNFLAVFNNLFLFLERAFVFFSSPISRELVTHIKKDSTVLPRIGALREVIFVVLQNYLN